MSNHINQILALRRLDRSNDDLSTCEFESINTLESLGRDGDGVAFGGCAIALTIHSAFQSLSEAQRKTAYPHSVLGNFLAPMNTQERLRLSVTSIRDTQSFATRLIKASQQRKGKAPVIYFIATVDILISPRQNILLEYTPPIPNHYTHHTKLDEYISTLDQKVVNGTLSHEARKKYLERHSRFLSLFQSKISPGGFNYGTVGGVMSSSLADELVADLSRQVVWERASSEWIRLRLGMEAAPKNHTNQLTPDSQSLTSACALAYVLDMLVFRSLMHSFKDFPDVSTAASLEFALRFHCDDIDVTSWLFRESKVPVAADERTYNESRCWQEKSDGSMQLVATMSQVGLFRKAQSRL